VGDIASANILALERLDEFSGRAFNLGNQRGYSIFEVLQKAREITGKDITANMAERRAGDPATLVAGSVRARQELGWAPELSDLETIIKSAWDWKLSHPRGYIS
jgi:UDP-glucose 4-epimerase